MKFIYFKILRFYQIVFKANDSSLYAFLLTSALLALNFMSIHLGYFLATNPKAKLNEIWSLILIGAAILLTYLAVLWKGKHKSITLESFPKSMQGIFGSILVGIYFAGSIFTILYIATLLRQYHI